MVEEIGSGNKLKKGPWSLGEKKVKVMCLGGNEGDEGEGESTGMLLGGRARRKNHIGSSVLRAFKSGDF